MSSPGSDPPPLDAVTSDIEDTGVYTTAGYEKAVGRVARKAALMCISGRSIGQIFILGRDHISVGRAPECDIFLDDEGVSRHHARVVHRDGAWLIVDVGSTNGLFLRGERIDVHTFVDGDLVHLGTNTILQFRYQDEREVEFHALMQNYKSRDPLTEALNRRAFVTELEKEVGYARRHGEPLSLLMFDVDHFKSINDTFGHLSGDRVLRNISARVQEMKRSEDAFARYGGEEFVILLRATDAQGAFLLAERIRRAVEELDLEAEGRRITCTISIGVATLGDGSAEELLSLADKRLYRAKANGRNRTESDLFSD